MTAAAEELTAEPAEPLGDAGSVRGGLKMLGYWITLGAAAGGLGGAVIGGIGGRLAMLLLRFTSPGYVRGLETDDGFIIGQFGLADTANLVLITTIEGAITGLLIVAGRPFFPRRGMQYAWALAGGVTGGALFINSDGIDFAVLEPLWLAVAMFIALPAVGAFAIAWLVELYPRFWWRDRKWTAVASVAAIPSIVIFPVAIAALVVGGLWFAALRVRTLRNLHHWMPARIFALAVFALVVAIGAMDLVRDVRDIL